MSKPEVKILLDIVVDILVDERIPANVRDEYTKRIRKDAMKNDSK